MLLKNGSIPLYVQLRELIRHKIKNREFSSNTFIPSEQEIGMAYGVSRITVREAFSNLINEGLLIRVPGKGTFVPNQEEKGKITPPTKRSEYKKLHTIGVVSPFEPTDESSPYYGSIIRGLRNTLSLSYNLWLLNVRKENGVDYLRIYDETNVDGLVIIAPPIPHKSNLLTLKEERVPFIIIGASFKNTPLNFIDTDNQAGAFRITEHIIKLGHKKIGLINGALCTADSRDRLHGYCLALKKYKIKYDKKLVMEIYPGYMENSYKAAEKLLKSSPAPTAIFAAGHELILGAVKKIREEKKRIPEDISLIGFDEVLLDFPITTVKQPIFEMGKRAGKELIKILKAENEGPVQIVLKTQLIKGKSCKRIFS